MKNIRETKREVLESPVGLTPIGIEEAEVISRDIHEKLSGRVLGLMMVLITEDGKGVQALEGQPIVLLDMANLAMKEAVRQAPMNVMAEFIGGLGVPGRGGTFTDHGPLDLNKKPSKPETIV